MFHTPRLSHFKEFYRGPGIIISTVMWEFFSLYGLRALLIFYLTQKFGFSDKLSFQLYASYITLIWLSPLVGSWIAENYLGFKNSVYLGCSLIILGHIVISYAQPFALYTGFALLICGIGFFKTNAICLISTYYKDTPEKLSSSMVLYYVGANIGATFGPIVCGYLQATYGYQIALAFAAIGMGVGLTILLLGRKKLAYINHIDSQILKNNKRPFAYILSLGLPIALVFLVFVIKNDWVSYVLLTVFLLAAYQLIKAINLLNLLTKKRLLVIFVLTLFATFFWVLDQQGSSSISLFILRNVKRHGIPAAAFQSINPVIIILSGLLLTFCIRTNKLNSNITDSLKVLFGITLLTLGYTCISISAKAASLLGHTSMLGPVLGLACMGLAELFIDPVILAAIGRDAPIKMRGSLTAIYYLFAGALANFLSGKVAAFSDVPKQYLLSKNSQASGEIYAKIFAQITLIGVIAMLILVAFITILYTKKRFAK